MSVRVFLGGTCGKSTWRQELIPVLKKNNIGYYNPVISGRKRNDQDREDEIRERKECDYVLYFITHQMRGVYSIAEIIDDSNKNPEKTLIYIEKEDKNHKYPIDGMYYSLQEVGDMAKRNHATVFDSYEDLIEFFNTMKQRKTIEALAYTE